MALAFRHRDYTVEKRVHSLPRTRVEIHPLCSSAPSPLQVDESVRGKNDFFDPLGDTDEQMKSSVENVANEFINFKTKVSNDDSPVKIKERDSIKKILMQRFPILKSLPVAMGNKALDDHQKNFKDVESISQHEYASQLRTLKDEINKAWLCDDRVTSVRLSIKVARLLRDTSVIQFYPTLFILVTDIMDMLGDLVWSRIKKKAKLADDGQFISSLPDNFQAADVCIDAKETCNNWFFKISSVSELLPRIYLELAILPCWCFVLDHLGEILLRLVMMTRGISDPLASAYCRLYLVQCAQRLPQHDTGYLITCINDLKVMLTRLMSAREVGRGNLSGSSKLLFGLIEPTVEYITHCLFKNLKQMDIGNMLMTIGMGINPSLSFEKCPSISIILHYILKELPIGFTCCNAMEILHLIECTNDCSFDQCLNFKLLGYRLCESISEVNEVHLVVDKITQVLSCYDSLGEYLMVADAYIEIIFENQLDTFPKIILNGISERVHEVEIDENSMMVLQSILMKFISHFGSMKDLLAMGHFIDILDMMNGSPRNVINMNILSMSTRYCCIQDPTFIEVLFQVSTAFYDGLNILDMRTDEYHHKAQLISRFAFMVDFGKEVENHLRFFAQCRGTFGGINELQELLVHSSNTLAVQAMKDVNCSLSFVKSCLAFSEVTIPSLCTNLQQLNMYIETAEVALLGGLVSRSHDLLDAAVSSLLNVQSDGTLILEDFDWIASLMCKLCCMFIIVPGSLEPEVESISRHFLFSLDSLTWIEPRMKISVLCSLLFLSAASSQNPLLYHSASVEAMANDSLFCGIPAYRQELLSLSSHILEDIINIVMQEPALAMRGEIALEMCCCIASSFMKSDGSSKACSKLVEIAHSCLSAEAKFLQRAVKFLHKHHYLE